MGYLPLFRNIHGQLPSHNTITQTTQYVLQDLFLIEAGLQYWSECISHTSAYPGNYYHTASDPHADRVIVGVQGLPWQQAAWLRSYHTAKSITNSQSESFNSVFLYMEL